MQRRTLIKSVGASIFSVGLTSRLAFGQEVSLGYPVVCPAPKNPKPPFPPRPVSGIHSGIHRKYSAYSYAELEGLIKDPNKHFIIASGIPRAPEMSGWTVKPLFAEDIVIWAKQGTGVHNITGKELRNRIEGRVGVFVNVQEEKFLPIRGWMQARGIDFASRAKWLEGGFGAVGYGELEKLAAGHEDPLVIGMRGGFPKEFRPITVDGFVPIRSEVYPLRKPVFAYFREEDVACKFWQEHLEAHQMEEFKLDQRIYKYLGVDIDIYGNLQWNE